MHLWQAILNYINKNQLPNQEVYHKPIYTNDNYFSSVEQKWLTAWLDYRNMIMNRFPSFDPIAHAVGDNIRTTKIWQKKN